MLGFRKDTPPERPVAPSRSADATPASAPGYSFASPSQAHPPTPFQEPAPHKRLGELLLSEKLVSEAQLAEAMAIQAEKGGFIGQILVQLGHVRQEEVASCLVKQCKIPHLSLRDYEIGNEVLSLIPREVCEKHNLLPIDKLGRILTVAMVDPLDLDALEEIRRVCPDLRIKPILCNWEHFETVSKKVFANKGGHDADAEITAQSLGLLSSPTAKQSVKPAAAPEPVPESAAVPSLAEAVPVGVTPPAGLSTGAEIGSAIRDSMNAAVQELVRQQSTAQPVPPSADSLTEAMRDTLREALSELKHQQAPAVSPSEIAQLMRDSMREALHEMAQTQARAASPVDLAQSVREAMREAVRELAQTQAPQAQAVSPVELAQVMKDSIREAMRELPSSGGTADGAAMAAALRQSVHEAVREMGEHLSRSQTGASQHELAETLRGSVQDAVASIAREFGAQQASRPEPPSVEQLAALIRDGVGGTLQEAMAGLVVHLRSESAQSKQAMPSADDLAGAIRDSVGGVMQETLAEMMVQLRANMSQQQAAAPDMTALVQGLRESISGAMQEAAAQVVVQMRGAAPENRTESPSLDPRQLADAIRDSVGGVMQESLAGMIVQMRALAGSHDDGMSSKMLQETLAEMVTQMRSMSDRRDENGVSPEAMVAIVRESVREALAAQQRSQESQGDQLRQIAEAALQSVRQVNLLVDTQKEEQAQSRQRRGERHASVAAFGGGGTRGAEVRPAEDNSVLDALESERPIETMTFANFCAGAANEFTVKLCQGVARNPGKDFNPFFLYGHVGIGKTHLISAIGNEILRVQASRRVGYVSASHFARRLMQAAKEDAIEAFRENYCHWDVLILDDIQFLAGRVEAQEEFFHIFNVLHQQGRQIIIASDKAPDQLGLLEQRLISRFASGIVTELKPPEWETRVEILRRQVAEAHATVPGEVISLIAMRVGKDVRKMSGSLKKIIAFSRLVQQDMSCEMANEILSHLGAGEAA